MIKIAPRELWAVLKCSEARQETITKGDTDRFTAQANKVTRTREKRKRKIVLMYHCGFHLFLSRLPLFDLKKLAALGTMRHKHTAGYTHHSVAVFHPPLSVAPFTQQTENWRGYLLILQCCE